MYIDLPCHYRPKHYFLEVLSYVPCDGFIELDDFSSEVSHACAAVSSVSLVRASRHASDTAWTRCGHWRHDVDAADAGRLESDSVDTARIVGTLFDMTRTQRGHGADSGGMTVDAADVGWILTDLILTKWTKIMARCPFPSEYETNGHHVDIGLVQNLSIPCPCRVHAISHTSKFRPYVVR